MDIGSSKSDGEDGGGDGSGVWAGGAAPVAERSAAQKKIDKDFLEACFEGPLEDVGRFASKGAGISFQRNSSTTL